MKNILLTGLIAVSFLSAKDLTLEHVEQVGEKHISYVQGKIKKELKKAKRKNGIEGMADFCMNESVKLIEAYDKKLGNKVLVKRISLNSRNDNAKAKKEEIKILKAFDLIQEADAYQPKQIVQIIDDNTYKVYAPIKMSSRDCKKCHGLDKRVKKDLKKQFLSKYKNENGYGYKSGEIRGAVVVTIFK